MSVRHHVRASAERAASTILFVEAASIAVLRFLTLVYTEARTAYAPDRARVGLLWTVVWIAVTVVVTGVFAVAGVVMRRGRGPGRLGAGIGGRVCLVLAWISNAALLVWAIDGLMRDRIGVQATVAWIVAAAAAAVVLVGAASSITSRGRSRTPAAPDTPREHL